MASPGILFHIYDVQQMLFITLFLICICFYVSIVWKKRYLLIKSWNYPGPLTLPLIGIPYNLICKNEDFVERFANMQEKYPMGGKMWFGNILFYYLHEPEHIRNILGSSKLVTKENLIYKYFKISEEDGILTAPAQMWKKHRRIIVPSFNQQLLNSFVEEFARKSLILNQILDENCSQDLDIDKILARCTLDITCETTMGVKSDFQRTNPDYAHLIDRILYFMSVKLMTLWYHFEILWKVFGHNQEDLACRKITGDFVDQIIQQKMDTIKKRKFSAASDNEAPLKRLPFLDHIIENGEFSEEQMKAEIKLMFAAATHTSSTALSFLFAMLGMFPAIQQKVYEEVTEIMGNDRSPAFKDLPQMIYTERVIKETLRIFPAVPLFFRAVTEDVDMGDFVVPKGATAIFGLLFIHRNPKYWPDPLKFDPDRFLPEQVAKKHPCTFIPFSYGPRNCIGMNYGMMVMKVIIATVVRKFIINCEYKKIEDIRVKFDFVLKFKEGAKVSMTPRQ